MSYAEEIVETLTRDIPSKANRTDRFAGTKAEEEAAKYVAKYFQSLGLKSKIEEYQFMGWECLAASELTILKPEDKKLDCSALIYCAATPEGGIEGSVEYMGKSRLVLFNWDKYGIVNEAGKNLGYLVGISDEEYTPLPRPEPWEYPEVTPVIVTVGNRDNGLLQKWLENGFSIKVNLKTTTKYKPQSTTYNVVGALEGRTKPDETVVIGCHIDSEYNVPGASDNASGVSTVISVAERMAGKSQSRTLEFIGFGAEEYGYIGSRARVRDTKDRGMLDRIRAMINIDTVGHPEATYIRLIAPENDSLGIRSVTNKAIKKIGIADKYDIRWETPIAPGGVDSFSYHAEGVPTLCIVWWPFPTMHTPEENKCNPEQINVTADIVEAILYEIEKI